MRSGPGFWLLMAAVALMAWLAARAFVAAISAEGMGQAAAVAGAVA